MQLRYFHLNFQQVAELQTKFGSYTNFGQAIHFVFQWLYNQVGNRIILVIENNTIGKAPIEYLTRNPEVADNFDYAPFLFKEKEKDDVWKDEYGIKTTGLTKPLMVGCLIEYVNNDPECIKSKQLITQFSSIQKTQTGSIKSSSYSDLFMACCFCALARSKKAIEIMPLISFTNQELEQKMEGEIKELSQLMNPKININDNNSSEEIIFNNSYETITVLENETDDINTFIPFFSN